MTFSSLYKKHIIIKNLITTLSLIYFIYIIPKIIDVWKIFPIYPDEIALRVWISRLFFDDFQRISPLSICYSSNSVPVPISLMSAAFLSSSLAFFKLIEYNRLLAPAFYGLSLLFIYFSLPRANMIISRITIIIILVLTLTLGVVANTFFIVRPECFLALLFSYCLYFSTNIISEKKNNKYLGLHLVFVYLLYTLSLYAHPKTLFFLPVILIFCAYVFYSTTTLKAILFMLTVIIATYDGYTINSWQYLHCPESQIIQDMTNSFNINLISAARDPFKLISDLADNNFSAKWMHIGDQMSFVESSDIDRLPKISSKTLEIKLVNLSIKFIAIIVFINFIRSMYKHGITIVLSLTRLCSNYKSIMADSFHAVVPILKNSSILFLYMAVFFQMILNKTNNFYDVGFWAYTCLSLTIFSYFYFYEDYCEIYLKDYNHSFNSRNLSNIFILSFALIILITVNTSTNLLQQLVYKEFLKGYSGPGISIIKTNFNEVNQNTTKALSECNLNKKYSKIIVDDLTYPFVENTYKPMLITYGSYAPGELFYIYSRAIGSAGLLTRCSVIPATFPKLGMKRFNATDDEYNSICCIEF